MESLNFIYYKTKRRFLTLIEVAISFTLVSIILFILFSNFKSIAHAQTQLEAVRPIILERQLFYQKLARILSLADPHSVKSIFQEGNPHPILTLTYDNGLDDPHIFSDQVRANLFLSRESELILEIWSMLDKNASKRVFLLREVEEIHWDLDTTDIVFLEIKQKSQDKNNFAFFLPKTLTAGYSLSKKQETSS